jgi:hypothetical protein
MSTHEKWYNKTSELFSRAKKNLDSKIFSSTLSTESNIHFKDCFEKLDLLKDKVTKSKELVQNSEKIVKKNFLVDQNKESKEGLCNILSMAMKDFLNFQQIVKRSILCPVKVLAIKQRISLMT